MFHRLKKNIKLSISLKTIYDIDIAVQALTETIQYGAWKATPPWKLMPNAVNMPEIYIY